MENNQSISQIFKIRSWTQVITVGALLSVALFLIFANIFKSYRSTVTIMITPKSEIAANQRQEIVANIAQLPGTLAFYDRLLKYNPQVRDVAAGDSPRKRKRIWDGMLAVKLPKENSSVIQLSIFAGSQSDANALAQITARNLFDTANFYYNIETDIDMRQIDGPISSPVVSDWQWLILLSIILGGTLAVLLQGSAEEFCQFAADSRQAVMERNYFDFAQGLTLPFKKEKVLSDELQATQEDALSSEEKNTVSNIPINEQIENSSSEKILRGKELETLNKIIEQDIYPNFPEMPNHTLQKASAPDNLPIGDDTYFPQMHEPAEASDSSPLPDPSLREPTPEELKDRLNKLLKGEL